MMKSDFVLFVCYSSLASVIDVLSRLILLLALSQYMPPKCVLSHLQKNTKSQDTWAFML